MNRDYLERYAFYPVSVGKTEAGRFIRRDDTGQVISTVSDRYTLISNRELVQPFIDKLGIENLSNVRSYNNGRSFLFEFFTKHEFDLGDGDIIKERFMLGNSYDKSRSFWFMCGAWRKVCSNGLYAVIGSALNFRKIHVGEIPVTSLVNHALENCQNNKFNFWRQLKNVKLSVDEQIEIVSQWQPFETAEPKIDPANPTKIIPSGNLVTNRWILDRATRLIVRPESIDNQRNGWGLYNQMNQAIDKVLSRGQVDKKIYGNARMEEYLSNAILN